MPPRRVASAPDSGVSPADDVLDSWKQIAGYLRRDVRTVIRWEATRGMPSTGCRAVRAGRCTRASPSWRRGVPKPGTPRSRQLPHRVRPLPSFRSSISRRTGTTSTSPTAWPTRSSRCSRTSPGFVSPRAPRRSRSAAVRRTRGRSGKRLGVSAVLEGTLRKAGDRIRVTVQLISTRDGYHLWAEQYDRSADDVFAIQDEIAEGVVKNLKVRLQGRAVALPARHHLPAPRGVPPLFEGQALLHSSRRGQDAARDRVLREAPSRSTRTTRPRTWVSPTSSPRSGSGGCCLPHRRSRASRRRPPARWRSTSRWRRPTWCSAGLLLADWDWERARGHFERAEGHPAPPTGPFSIGFYYVIAGRSADAFRYFQRRVREGSPFVHPADAGGNRAHRAAGVRCRDDAAGRSARPRRPVPMTLVWLGFCRGVQGRLDEALPLLGSAADRGIATALPHLASVLVRVGAADRAQAVHAQLEQMAGTRYVSPTCLALSHAALGHGDRCRELLGPCGRRSVGGLHDVSARPGLPRLVP